MADAHVHVLAGEVNVMHGGADSQVDVRMLGGEPAQPPDQPLGGEVGRHADRQGAAVVAGAQGIEPRRQAVEGLPDEGLAGLSRFAQDQAPGAAEEQLHS
jgi:hypothetical protein